MPHWLIVLHSFKTRHAKVQQNRSSCHISTDCCLAAMPDLYVCVSLLKRPIFCDCVLNVGMFMWYVWSCEWGWTVGINYVSVYHSTNVSVYRSTNSTIGIFTNKNLRSTNTTSQICFTHSTTSGIFLNRDLRSTNKNSQIC